MLRRVSLPLWGRQILHMGQTIIIKEQTDKLDFFKVKGFSSSATVKKMKRQVTD